MKLRKTLSLLLAVLTLSALLTGCGAGGKDWSQASWEDYDPATFLDKGDVAYSIGVYEKTASADSHAAWAPTHLMLYEDGSAAAYTSFDNKEVFHNFDVGCGIPAYDDNEIITAWYGWWTEQDGTVKIVLKGQSLNALYENGALRADVNLDETLIVKKYEAEVDENGIITLLDFETQGNGFVAHPIQSANPPKFNTLQEFVDSIPENMPEK